MNLTFVPTFVWSLDAPTTAKWREDMKAALVLTRDMIVSQSLKVDNGRNVEGMLRLMRTVVLEGRSL